MQSDVAIFQEACGQKVYKTPSFKTDTPDQTLLYLELIREEFEELEQAHHDKDIIEAADAVGDLIWVVLGYCNSIGIPIAPVWQAICESNMSKIPEGGKVLRRADGKILKPDTFFEPNIHRALGIKK
jgi:predicted HAD superfamily Cof-like phosphohydrolase